MKQGRMEKEHDRRRIARVEGDDTYWMGMTQYEGEDDRRCIAGKKADDNKTGR